MVIKMKMYKDPMKMDEEIDEVDWCYEQRFRQVRIENLTPETYVTIDMHKVGFLNDMMPENIEDIPFINEID